MSETERAARNEARAEILKRANQFKKNSATPLFMRHLNRAIRICRFNRLADSSLLKAAGF